MQFITLSLGLGMIFKGHKNWLMNTKKSYLQKYLFNICMFEYLQG